MNRIHIFCSVCLACALAQAVELVRLSARDPEALTAIAKGTNLAANASMEEGTTMPAQWRWQGWNKANVTGKWEQSESHAGQRCLSQIHEDGSGYSIWLSERALGITGDVFLVGAWIKTIGQGAGGVRFEDRGNALSAGPLAQTDGKWQYIACAALTGEKPLGRMAFAQKEFKGQTMIDEVSIFRGSFDTLIENEMRFVTQLFEDMEKTEKGEALAEVRLKLQDFKRRQARLASLSAGKSIQWRNEAGALFREIIYVRENMEDLRDKTP